MYAVSLPHFEGPLDLLLFFVQRDELDIHDIPIARVTDDFLAYTRAMQTVDLDGAGEFIFFAALLISIKARTLLPVQETDDAGEPVDPRRELVERLLEYVRFKEAAAGLAALEAARALHATRTPEPAEPLPAEDAAVAGGTVLDLVRALRRILTQPVEAAQHAVRRVRVTVDEALAALWTALSGGARVTFAGFTRARPRAFVIAALLGVLESVRGGTLRLRVAAGDDFIEPTPDPAPSPERPATEPA